MPKTRNFPKAWIIKRARPPPGTPVCYFSSRPMVCIIVDLRNSLQAAAMPVFFLTHSLDAIAKHEFGQMAGRRARRSRTRTFASPCHNIISCTCFFVVCHRDERVSSRHNVVVCLAYNFSHYAAGCTLIAVGQLEPRAGLIYYFGSGLY